MRRYPYYVMLRARANVATPERASDPNNLFKMEMPPPIIRERAAKRTPSAEIFLLRSARYDDRCSTGHSGLITAWGEGDKQALRSLMPAVYPELGRIARRHLGRCQAGQTLESAAASGFSLAPAAWVIKRECPGVTA